jgi:hypothetical protein
VIRSWTHVTKSAAKELFGRPLRVVLTGWILEREGESFFSGEAITAMSGFGEASSGVSKELGILVRYGLLQSVPSGRRVYFTPLDHPFWSAFAAISEAFEQSGLTMGSRPPEQSDVNDG